MSWDLQIHRYTKMYCLTILGFLGYAGGPRNVLGYRHIYTCIAPNVIMSDYSRIPGIYRMSRECPGI